MIPYDKSLRAAPSTVEPISDLQLHAKVIARDESIGGNGNWMGLLWLTGILFFGFGGLQWGWEMIGGLVIAIFLHEMGHVIAMRAFGYKNVRMLFLPFLGALTAGEPRELDATRNALIALAGPAFGLMTVVATIVVGGFLGSAAWLVEFAWVALFLNAFNLIPFVPLDGGQLANDTLFSRYPVLELSFRVVAIIGLVWLTFAMEMWLFGIVPLFMAISTPYSYRRACAAQAARRDPSWQTRPLDVETVGLLRAEVVKIFRSVPVEKYEKKLPEHVHGLWLEIRKRFPGPGRTVALLLGYLLTCSSVPFIAVYLIRTLGRP